jgi:hypothetical protein
MFQRSSSIGVHMIVREILTHGGPFTAYRIPDIHYTGDRGKHQKQVNCVNTFFHRSARDGIKHNLTNQRRFLQSDDASFLKEEELRRENGQSALYEIVECGDMDTFFEKVGFDYRTKIWARPDEWSMRVKVSPRADGLSDVCFVDPPAILRLLAKGQGV